MKRLSAIFYIIPHSPWYTKLRPCETKKSSTHQIFRVFGRWLF